jgi:CheY-like chemotaxis protein
MPNILIIDDEVIVRRSLRTVLEKAGYQVVETCNGSEGLDFIRQKEPVDLIILDIIMPIKGGIETLMELKKERSHAKIIIITGKVSTDSPSFNNLTKYLGVHGILKKPFTKQMLLSLIEETLTA